MLNLDIISIFTVYIISLTSTLAGIGGGALYTSSLLLIYNFDIKSIVPISISLIFFTSSINAIFFLMVNNPNSQINYKVLLILVPFLSGTSFVGNILLKTMPKIITMLCIVLLIIFSIFKGTKKLLELSNKSINTTNIINSLNFSSYNPLNEVHSEVELTSIENQHDQISTINITITRTKMFICFLLLLIITMSESFFSIIRKYLLPCSNNFVLICFGQIIFTLILGISIYFFLNNNISDNLINKNFDKIQLSVKNIITLWLIGGIVGILGSWSSMGGAIILNPILFLFGLDPL